MIVLTDSQREEILKGLMSDVGLSRDLTKVQTAMQGASKKFGIKFSISKRGTYHESWKLKTNYATCEEVRDYLTAYCRVFISVSNGVVNFPAGWERSK
jgi:hypothetical protein